MQNFVTHKNLSVFQTIHEYILVHIVKINCPRLFFFIFIDTITILSWILSKRYLKRIPKYKLKLYVTGEQAIRSRYARLTVLVPPEPPRIVEGSFFSTIEDRNIKLECVSVGGKPPAEVRTYLLLVYLTIN